MSSDLGPIDLLVHAAALMPSHKLAEHTHEGMEKLFRINYFGTTYMVRAVLPSMLERGSGRIIAFGSIAGIALVPKMGAYCATKAAVNAYMEVLQNEIRDTGVRAHLVCPPAVNTPLVDQTLATDSPGSISRSPKNGRLADPEKIVDAIEKGVRKDRDIIYPEKPDCCTCGAPCSPAVVEDGDELREISTGQLEHAEPFCFRRGHGLASPPHGPHDTCTPTLPGCWPCWQPWLRSGRSVWICTCPPCPP